MNPNEMLLVILYSLLTSETMTLIIQRVHIMLNTVYIIIILRILIFARDFVRDNFGINNVCVADRANSISP